MSNLDTFGYNGILELDQDLVNRVLSSYLYESNLITINGQLSDADFLAPMVFNRDLRLYLLIGRPQITFDNHDGTNLATLSVPFFGLSVFQFDTQTSTPIDLQLGSESFGLKVSDLAVQLAGATLTLDTTNVTADSVSIYLFSFVEPPTDVGGQAVGEADLPDAWIDATFASANVNITAKQLRGQIAAALKNGTLGPTSFSLQPGGVSSDLGTADLMTLDPVATGNAAAVLGLYGANASGQGVRTEMSDVIPAPDASPGYSWTAGLRADVLLAEFSATFDAGMYLKQGGVPNTPAAPTGYMTVPASGQTAFSVPGATNSVVVHAPSGGKVVVAITQAFSAHSRGHLTVVGTNTVASFTVDGNKNASVTIAAAAGARLAIEIYAATTSGDTSAVIWRPTITFQDGSLRLDFHFYKYLWGPCDAEGDGYIVLKLAADRTAPFKLSATVSDSNFDVPWWVYMGTWFLGSFLSILGGAFGSIVVATKGEDYIKGDVNPQQKVNNLLGPLDGALASLRVPATAMFLDLVLVSVDGVVLAGRGDAAPNISWGRVSVPVSANGLELESGGLGVGFGWQATAGNLAIIPPWGCVPAAGATADGYWSATYDELAYPPYPSNSTPVSVAAGEAAVFWLDTGTALAKVLLEFSAPTGNAADQTVLATWITYRKRVALGASIHNGVKAISRGGSDGGIISVEYFAYQGSLTLDRTKFFLTSDTFLAGWEHWTWDGVEVTSAGLTVPGGVVTVDGDNHALDVQLDETQLPLPSQDTGTHTVVFAGTDVFGRSLTAKLQLQMPVRTLRLNPIASLTPGWLRDPLGPWENVINNGDRSIASLLAAAIAANPALAPISKTVIDALSNGSATLDARGALALVNLVQSVGR
jgi:hypothetical protein